MKRVCAFIRPDGERCRAAPVRDAALCFMHDPRRATEAAEARRLGGIRRRRESTLEAAYDLAALDTVDGIRRLLEIAVADALGLENGLGRLRVLIAAATAAAKLLETGDLEARLRSLELVAQQSRPDPGASPTVGLLDGPDE